MSPKDAIDWKKAPEGTTQACWVEGNWIDGSPSHQSMWERVSEGVLYFHNGYRWQFLGAHNQISRSIKIVKRPGRPRKGEHRYL